MLDRLKEKIGLIERVPIEQKQLELLRQNKPKIRSSAKQAVRQAESQFPDPEKIKEEKVREYEDFLQNLREEIDEVSGKLEEVEGKRREGKDFVSGLHEILSQEDGPAGKLANRYHLTLPSLAKGYYQESARVDERMAPFRYVKAFVSSDDPLIEGKEINLEFGSEFLLDNAIPLGKKGFKLAEKGKEKLEEFEKDKNPELFHRFSGDLGGPYFRLKATYSCDLNNRDYTRLFEAADEIMDYTEKLLEGSLSEGDA